MNARCSSCFAARHRSSGAAAHGRPLCREIDQHIGELRRLWNLAGLIEPPERRVTRISRGRDGVIDHILASRRLVDPNATPKSSPSPPAASIADDPTSGAKRYSNHVTVIATFSP